MDTSPTENVLAALELDELTPEDQETLLVELNDLIFQGTMVRLIDQMDEATKADFEKLMETNADEETVETFLKERVPEADQAVTETIEDLTGDILAAAQS